MAMTEKPALPGRLTNRTDKNLTQRTQKIQRNAKIQNAAGGQWGSRQENRGLIQEGGVNTPTASATSAGIPQQNVTVGDAGQSRPATKTVSAFEKGNPNVPFADGAGGNTAGASPNALMANMNVADPGSILIRAMYLANPTPELRRMVEAYNEEGNF